MKKFRPLQTAWLLCAALLLAAGCVRAPRPFFTGLYDVPREKFSLVHDAGFDVVVAPASTPALEDAARAGVKLIARYDWLGEHPDPAALREWDGHPALAGWYLQDEPDLNLIAPERVKASRGLLNFSRKPAVLVLTSGAAAEKYSGVADLFGIDCYPVPWGPAALVGREMRSARLALGEKPFFAVLQAFDWNAFSNHLRTDIPLRAPRRDELRCMAYLSLIQGARGLLFYTFENDRWNLMEHPELWQSVRDVTGELRERAEIFARRVPWWPARTEYHGAPSEMYNELFEGRITLGLFKVDKARGAAARGYYLIAVNTSGTPVDFSFKLPFRNVTAVETFCAGNQFQASDGWIRKTYAPFEVCIFGPINAPLARE